MLFLMVYVPMNTCACAHTHAQLICCFFFCGGQRSITYLFPSGLFEKRARPLMKVSNWLLEHLEGQMGLLRLQYNLQLKSLDFLLALALL